MNRKRTNRVLAITLILVMAVAQFSFAANIEVTDAVLTVNNVESAPLTSGDNGTIRYTMEVDGYLANATEVIYNTEFTIDADGNVTPVKTATHTFAAQEKGIKTTFDVVATVTHIPEFDSTTITEQTLTLISEIPNQGSGNGQLHLLGGENNRLTVELVADSVVDDQTDTEAPVITAPADITVEATALETPVDLGTATAIDNKDAAPSITNNAPEAFPLGTTTVTWTATDTAGNSSTATQNVTIVDTTAPVLTVPDDVEVTLTGALTQVNLGVATATDIFGATVTNNAPADGFKIGTTNVTYTAKDPNGNSTTGTQKVHVRYANSGILQPINKDGSSQFKLGSTVPVKIQLKDASGNAVSTAINTITAQKYTNAVLGTVLETVTSTTSSTGNVMRYDATSGQYIYNLSTKGWTSGSYHIIITLDDGTVTKVDISSK